MMCVHGPLCDDCAFKLSEHLEIAQCRARDFKERFILEAKRNIALTKELEFCRAVNRALVSRNRSVHAVAAVQIQRIWRGFNVRALKFQDGSVVRRNFGYVFDPYGRLAYMCKIEKNIATLSYRDDAEEDKKFLINKCLPK